MRCDDGDRKNRLADLFEKLDGPYAADLFVSPQRSRFFRLAQAQRGCWEEAPTPALSCRTAVSEAIQHAVGLFYDLACGYEPSWQKEQGGALGYTRGGGFAAGFEPKHCPYRGQRRLYPLAPPTIAGWPGRGSTVIGSVYLPFR